MNQFGVGDVGCTKFDSQQKPKDKCTYHEKKCYHIISYHIKMAMLYNYGLDIGMNGSGLWA